MHLLPRKKKSVPHFKPPGEVQVRKWDFAWRILVFLALESAFLALATYCLEKPIPLLPSSSTSLFSEAKAVTTVIAVTWHRIALFPINGIISTVLSAECVAQYRHTGLLRPNVTDRVSCITSGLLAQASHFLTLRPTPEYRLAFLLVVSIMILVPLGPSVISLSPTWITHHEILQVANLTMVNGFLSAPQQKCFVKADEIVNFELIGGTTYGYKAQTDGVLIPWLIPGFETSQKIVKYNSDVVSFNYSCHWPEFTFNKTHVAITGIPPHISWSPWGDAFFQDVILPLSNPQDNPISSSAFIFLYKDPKFHDDLGTVTTWINITSEYMVGDANTTVYFEGGMAGVLLCDPQYTIRGAEVTLQDGQLNTTLDEVALLGNFPESAANSLFSQALLKAFAPSFDNSIGAAVVKTFTMSQGNTPTLLSLPEINQNMNKIVQSAAKAYISGYTGGSQQEVFPSYSSFNQTVAVQDQHISLISSRLFVVGLWALYALMVLLLAALLWATNVEEMLLFNLQTMETIYRNLPTDDGDLSSSQQHHLDATKLGFTRRIIIFATLEVGFLAFAGYCLTNPIPVHLPSFISPPQAISVTTAVVVAWRTLAIIPIKDIISSVFSAECVAQYHREEYLEPNRTDRVSRATSGLVDQISFFWASQPTLEYRLAFLLVFLVAFIGPLGPSVVSLTESPMANFRIADMSLYGTNLASLLSVSQRVRPLLELEMMDGEVYGYDTMEEGVLIPWPESGLEQGHDVATYGSDVATYDYSCHWTPVQLHSLIPTPPEAPVLPGVTIPGVTPNNNTVWVLLDSLFSDFIPLQDLPQDEAIYSLTPFGLNLTLPAPIPLSAIIFSGNSTRMDLGSTGTSFRNGSSETLYSVLLCDPQYKIRRANVTLSNGQISANILPDLPLIGNFPEAAATALFFQAFLGVFGPQEEDPSRFLDPISMLIFTGQFNKTDPQPPLSLPVINANMNRALKSAAKAFLSGAYIPDGSTLQKYSFWGQITVQSHQPALVASRPFFIGLLALVAVTFVILVVLLKVMDIGKVQLFNLQTLSKIYTDEMFAGEDRKNFS